MSRPQSHDSAPPDLPGYRFIRHLGAGGNAQVYLYEQDLPHREVAVKVLNESALSEAARRRFTAEANVTAGLAHRHIVQVFDAKVTSDGQPYIVMPYYPQPNLLVRARRAHLSVAEVLRIGIQIGSAVETSHRRGVLHRDIKPQNILTDSYGEPALTDFGIATTKGGDGPEGLSVPWSPPEILYGTGTGDQRSDVYSLGATLWHVLAGRSPFEQPGGDNKPFALMGRIKSDPVPPTGRADVPDSLERLLRQAMAKDPAARPQTAMELIRGLQSVEQELRLPVTQPVLPVSDPGDGDSRPPTGTHTHRTGAGQQSRGQTGPPLWGGAVDDATIARGLPAIDTGVAPGGEGTAECSPPPGLFLIHVPGDADDPTRARGAARGDPSGVADRRRVRRPGPAVSAGGARVRHPGTSPCRRPGRSRHRPVRPTDARASSRTDQDGLAVRTRSAPRWRRGTSAKGQVRPHAGALSRRRAAGSGGHRRRTRPRPRGRQPGASADGRQPARPARHWGGSHPRAGTWYAHGDRPHYRRPAGRIQLDLRQLRTERLVPRAGHREQREARHAEKARPRAQRRARAASVHPGSGHQRRWRGVTGIKRVMLAEIMTIDPYPGQPLGEEPADGLRDGGKLGRDRATPRSDGAASHPDRADAVWADDVQQGGGRA